MKAKCCPRCLTVAGDPEDGQIHTCTPTAAWRKLETRVAELEHNERAGIKREFRKWKDGVPVFFEDEAEIFALKKRVAELESAIVCGFKNWSEGGLYAEVIIDADFFETLKPQP